MSNNNTQPQVLHFNPNRKDNNIDYESSDEDKKKRHGTEHVTHAVHQVKEYIKDSNTRFIDNHKFHNVEGHNPEILLERAKDKKKEFRL